MTGERDFYTFRGYLMMPGEQKMTPSMEDYLEMIYRLHSQQTMSAPSWQNGSTCGLLSKKTVQKLAGLGL